MHKFLSIRFVFFATILLILGLFIVYPKPLWLDECALGFNLISKSYLELLKPLEMIQVAPIGFLYLTKTIAFIGQYSDLSLRIPSIIALLLTYFFIYNTTKNYGFHEISAILPLVMFSSIINFGFEFKPYIFDALGLAFFYYTHAKSIQSKEFEFSKYYNILFVLVLSWLSFISLILLPLLIFVEAIRSYKNQIRKIPFKVYSLFFILGSSLLIYYFSFIFNHPSAGEQVQYWEDRNHFLKLNFSAIDFIFNHVISFVKFNIVGFPHFNHFPYFNDKFTLLIRLSISILIALPCLVWVRKKKYYFGLYILPFIFHLFLSLFKIFPFDSGRLTMYLSIPTILIFANSINFIYENVNFSKTPLTILTLIMSFILMVNAIGKNITGPIENFRSVLESMDKTEKVILVGSVIKHWKFYKSQYTYQGKDLPNNVSIVHTDENMIAEIRESHVSKITIVSAHSSVLMSKYNSEAEWISYLNKMNVYPRTYSFYSRNGLWYSSLTF
jgi:hypothetical protein